MSERLKLDDLLTPEEIKKAELEGLYNIFLDGQELKSGRKLDDRCAKINGWEPNVFTDNSPAPYSADVGLAFELLDTIRAHPKTIQVDIAIDSMEFSVWWVTDYFGLDWPIILGVADHNKPALALCRAVVTFEQIRERMGGGDE